MKTTYFRPARITGYVLSAVFFPLLFGCATGPGRSSGSSSYGQTDVMLEDDYVYYPGYEVYYSSRRHNYVYRDGSNWVTRPAPPRVGADVLLASPSVRVDFHDSPAQHHATVVKSYPKNWQPPTVSHEGQKDNRPNDKNERGDGRKDEKEDDNKKRN